MKIYLINKFSFGTLKFWELKNVCKSSEIVIPVNTDKLSSAHPDCSECDSFCCEMNKYLSKMECNQNTCFELTIFKTPLASRFGARLEGDLLKALYHSFGYDERVWLQLQLFDVRAYASDSNPTWTDLSPTESREFQMKLEEGIYFADATVRCPDDWRKFFGSKDANKYLVGGFITVKMGVNNSSIAEILPNLQLFHNEDIISINKRILCGHAASDLQLCTADGIVIPCHQFYLKKESPVFATMLENKNFVEGQTNKIKLEDMTEIPVRALLNYLYCRNIMGPMTNCTVAMELLKCANKYNINTLETTMKEILLTKPSEWFDVSTALKLFFFGCRLEGGMELKQKGIQVLKRKPETEIQNSVDYNELFSENPDAGKELCTALLHTCPN